MIVLPEEWKGEVKITSNSIVVSYKDESGMVNYKGKEQGKGHYILTAPERNGKATLYKFKGSKILELLARQFPCRNK